MLIILSIFFKIIKHPNDIGLRLQYTRIESILSRCIYGFSTLIKDNIKTCQVEYANDLDIFLCI